MKRLSLVFLISLTLAACAHLPVKQQATDKLTASIQLLGTAQDAERTLCSPTADKTKPITHCDGAGASAVGLTDARHQAAARAFAAAFDGQIKAAIAIRGWQAGDPPPANLADVMADAQAALVVVHQLTSNPSVTHIADTLQQAIDGLVAIQHALSGGK